MHRHLRKDGEGKAARPLTLRKFLDLLRDHYGLYVDREPPGMSVPQDLLRANKAWLERRLRDLRSAGGVNDAESMKQLRARFAVPVTGRREIARLRVRKMANNRKAKATLKRMQAINCLPLAET